MTDDKADLEACWPRLISAAYYITSRRTTRREVPSYNCVAWVEEDTAHWWEPEERGGFYWPPGLSRDDPSLDNYLAAFERMGFRPCDDGSLQTGIEKIAVYVDDDNEFTHVAVQLECGWWTSKLGDVNDISHERLDSLMEGRPQRYGETLTYMARPRTRPSRPRSGIVVAAR